MFLTILIPADATDRAMSLRLDAVLVAGQRRPQLCSVRM
jgi:hypothetical protein